MDGDNTEPYRSKFLVLEFSDLIFSLLHVCRYTKHNLPPRHSRAFSSPYPVLEDVTIQLALIGDKDIKMLLRFSPRKFCSNLSDKMIACCSTQTSTSLEG